MPARRKSQYTRPASIGRDKGGKIYRANRIVNEKRAEDGSMLYFIDWEGYPQASEPGSHEHPSKTTRNCGSRAAIRRDLECIISEAPQGYFVKRFDKPAEEAEWYPSSLIGAELLEEWQATKARLEDIEIKDAENSAEALEQQEQSVGDSQSKQDSNLARQLQILEEIRSLEEQQHEAALSSLRSEKEEVQAQLLNMQASAERSNGHFSPLQAENEQLRQQLLTLQQQQANTPQGSTSTTQEQLICAAINDTTVPHDDPYHCDDPQHQPGIPRVSCSDCLNDTMIKATDDQYIISNLGALVRLCSACYNMRLENGYFPHQCKCFDIKRCPSCTLTWLNAMLTKNAEIKEVSQEFTICCQCKRPVQGKLSMCGICKGWKERA